MSAALLLRLMLRQSRGSRGRMAFFAGCIAVGVAAVVGVGALVDAIEATLRDQSRELLGGDIEVESRRPLPDVSAHLPAARRAGAQQVELTVLPTMVRNAAGASRLAEVTAIDERRGRYPLAGNLQLLPNLPLHALLDDRAVVITPELGRDLKLAIGDPLRIGQETFTVRGVALAQPQRLQFSFAFGPGLLLTRGGLQRAALLGFGDRVRYRTLIALTPAASGTTLAEVKRALNAAIPGGGTFVQVETHDEAQPALRNSLELARRYLGLVALLSLLLGCVGVAQIVSTWIAQSAEQTAVLRCLGLRPRDVLLLYLGHVVLVATAGSLAGGLVGLAAPPTLASAYPALGDLRGAGLQWAALARGVGLGVFVALLFCLPPLTAIWKVAPARVLSSQAAPLPVPRVVRFASLAACALAVFLAALWQARNALQALAFAGGVAALAALLWLAAAALQRLVARLPRERLPPLVWQGAAALARPSAGTTGSMVALGLGTLVILAILLVEDVVGGELNAALPADAPSVFLADVQADQWPGIEQLAVELGARYVQSAPVVTGRIAKVDGRPVADLVRERTRRGEELRRTSWVFTREQRITWARQLPEHNAIVAGKLWSRPGVGEVSVEQDYARDLGVKLGSTIGFDVQGVPIDMVVTSIRNIEWRSFSPNFLLVAEPGVLDDAPYFRIGAMRVDAAEEQALQDAIAARYPNVTLVRVRSMIERVSELLQQLALGVRLLGAFAVLTGLVILAGAAAASQLRRAHEAALLKTLGVTRSRVAAMFAIEYALLGAVAGFLGAAFAYGLALGFTSEVLGLPSTPSVALLSGAVIFTALLSIMAGLLASFRALLVPPLHVLRQQA